MGKVSKCCVYGCNDVLNKRHRFPKKNPTLFKTWVDIIKPTNWQKLSDLQIYNRYVVCHTHFEDIYKLEGSSRGLTDDAVPTIGVQVAPDVCDESMNQPSTSKVQSVMESPNEENLDPDLTNMDIGERRISIEEIQIDDVELEEKLGVIDIIEQFIDEKGVYERKEYLAKNENATVRAKWEQSLGQKLTPGQFVCEKHFRDADIKKTDRFIIDGVETFLSRKVWTLLNENVVPINRHGSKIDISEEKDPLGSDEIEQSHNPDTSSQNVEEVKIEEDLHFTEIYHMEYLSEHAAENNVLPPPPSLTERSALTLEEIRSHFSSTLMQGWCYFAKDEELIFSRINIQTRKEDRHFSVDKNLSVKVSVNGGPEYSTNDTISCLEDIKIYMKKLQKTMLCEGTGHHIEKFSPKCTGRISNDDYKRWRKILRCPCCRSLRKKLQRRKYSTFKVKITPEFITRSKKDVVEKD
ncbi:uncharacterized protein LOC123308523 isoform X5 [Coccinella septempunctata]|uniref:uncharacterized protein LOC123308523 isoform X5 n=1 Tax=Coccinella septempunctata TaxID=41139 RepID=UPI001D0823F3|nr:uncharacterized protein LOC123308523 isoform X5 [Coccinella septempunctata]